MPRLNCTLRPLLVFFLASAAGEAGAAGAANNVVMVELFTSQGCSSCPPADRTIAELADHDDVLALSFHVDYWNYLGWPDTFAREEHTARQAEYRDKLGNRVLFTPQIVVDGVRSVPGSKRAMITAAIKEAAEAPQLAVIDIGSEDGMLHATISSKGGHGPSTIWMASYDAAASVTIERGENAGRSFTYRNVVDKLMKVGHWQPDGPESYPLPQPGPGEGIAVWLQDDRTGRILCTSYFEQ